MNELTSKQLGQARAWMREEETEHVDLATGELNCTQLAEAASDEFGHTGRDGDVPEELFELAFGLVDEEGNEHVEKAFACPGCGESRVDRLVWNEGEGGEFVDCQTCGRWYDPSEDLTPA